MNTPVVQELRLTNILSFGSETEVIPLGSLNVLIGPNGSGKSNLLEIIGLLHAAPKDLSAPVREAGGVREWLWKGTANPVATIEAIIQNPAHPDLPLRHIFSFREQDNRFEITTERIENRESPSSYNQPSFYYRNQNGHFRLRGRPQQRAGIQEGPVETEDRELPGENINPEKSIVSQIKDPEHYPTLSRLTETYESFCLYRDWTFGRHSPLRQPQKADLPTEYLSETGDNLPLVLNSLRPRARPEILKALNCLFPEIEDFSVQIEGGWARLYLEEGGFSIPATRLSDGILRYLCLIAILCHPDPPPLICIEEPELGLHPDVLPHLADLIITASGRCQLIVTTCSDILVDALSETPESVIVCGKSDGRTTMKRLSRDDLRPWSGKYRLGELWLKGEIGGTCW